MTDPSVVLLTGAMVGVGALVQSTVGFGLAVVAAPLVVLMAPELMPVSLLVAAFALPVVQIIGRRPEVSWPILRWALAGRLLLTPVGVAAVALLPVSAIAALVGVLVLVAVALSIWAVDVHPTTGRAFGAGMISGVSGTAAAIGGPFLALVLQHDRPDRARGTLAVFFLAGSALGLGSLSVVGEVSRDQLVAGVTWVPFVILGHLGAGPLRRRLSGPRFRQAVLALAVVASVVVLARAVIG